MQYLLQSATYTANNYQVQARKPFRVAPECLENPKTNNPYASHATVCQCDLKDQRIEF